MACCAVLSCLGTASVGCQFYTDTLTGIFSSSYKTIILFAFLPGFRKQKDMHLHKVVIYTWFSPRTVMDLPLIT